jgi:trans-aconitate methyltransferase
MLEQGRAQHLTTLTREDVDRFSYVKATFDSFQPTDPVDLIFANAAIHWVSSELHKTLIPRLLSFLNPGGVLAFQIPDTRLLPSHQLMREAAKQLGWEEDIANVRWVTCEQEPSFYYEIFEKHLNASDLRPCLDMWSTTYAQIMEGENPVAEFTSSTGLGPYLEALGGRGSPRALQFEAKYRELITNAYTKQNDGHTIFNLKRFFVIATKPVDALT